MEHLQDIVHRMFEPDQVAFTVMNLTEITLGLVLIAIGIYTDGTAREWISIRAVNGFVALAAARAPFIWSSSIPLFFVRMSILALVLLSSRDWTASIRPLVDEIPIRFPSFDEWLLVGAVAISVWTDGVWMPRWAVIGIRTLSLVPRAIRFSTSLQSFSWYMARVGSSLTLLEGVDMVTTAMASNYFPSMERTTVRLVAWTGTLGMLEVLSKVKAKFA